MRFLGQNWTFYETIKRSLLITTQLVQQPASSTNNFTLVFFETYAFTASCVRMSY
jgi:hypothetical protein